MKNSQQLHWGEEREAIKTNGALRFTLFLMKWTPRPFVYFLIHCSTFFFLITNKRARAEALLYQKQLREYTHGCVPRKLSAYSQLFSFALCIVEKMQGWLGKVDYSQIVCHDDDLPQLIDLLEKGRGAILIGSHLGNLELLRSLSSFNQTGVSRHIEVVILMEVASTKVFNQTLASINPGVKVNVIDASNIGIDTIDEISQKLDSGALVVYTGDRTPKLNRTKSITQDFLGRRALFPYGVYLLTILLKAPTFFCFGIRTKTFAMKPRYHMFIERAQTKLDAGHSEREDSIKALCAEFVSKLEKYCIQYPFQWYNFYDFWLIDGEEEQSCVKEGKGA